MTEPTPGGTAAPRRPLAAALFRKDRPWLNILLFMATGVSVVFMGFSWSASYLFAESFAQDSAFQAGSAIFRDPRVIGLSLIYTVVLMTILLAHELGHYLTCRRYGLSATLPFFIPAPFTMIGTFGAFIKIRSPIGRKKVLFDIGLAGPLAGFALAVPALVVGLAFSKIVPTLPREESLVFGEPLLLQIVGAFILKNAGPGFDVVLHPVAFAGWVGLLISALNLFPLGQLDGGHVAYAALGRKTRYLSPFILALFLAMAFIFWAGWLIWFFMLLLLGVKHPRLVDEDETLGKKRTLLLVVAVLIFILSFIPAPIKGYNIFELIRSLGR